MKKLVCLLTILFSLQSWIQAAPDSANKDLNTPRTFPKIDSKAEWQKRAQEIREQVLVSCGLWPIPEKTQLKAHVFGKMIRDGYSIEKVYFQSYPGFYVAGNLYRPLGKGKFPARVEFVIKLRFRNDMIAAGAKFNNEGISKVLNIFDIRCFRCMWLTGLGASLSA